MQGKCWLIQNFKRYLTCRKDIEDKVKEQLGIVSNIPGDKELISSVEMLRSQRKTAHTPVKQRAEGMSRKFKAKQTGYLK